MEITGFELADADRSARVLFATNTAVTAVRFAIPMFEDGRGAEWEITRAGARRRLRWLSAAEVALETAVRCSGCSCEGSTLSPCECCADGHPRDEQGVCIA